ncbi:MAG: hypothetical protein ACLQU1_18770 [Bryobacteraceae bacterium]
MDYRIPVRFSVPMQKGGKIISVSPASRVSNLHAACHHRVRLQRSDIDDPEELAPILFCWTAQKIPTKEWESVANKASFIGNIDCNGCGDVQRMLNVAGWASFL